MKEMILFKSNIGVPSQRVMRCVLIVLETFAFGVRRRGNLTQLGCEFQVGEMWKTVWVVLPICKGIDNDPTIDSDLDIVAYVVN